MVKSENLHTINVIKKAIKIKKTDMVGTLLTDTAEFTLYRKAVNGDTNTVSLTNVTGLEDGNYVAVVQSTVDGYATFDPVYPIKDADGTYKQQTTDFWLVETNPPSTYTAMSGAVKVTPVWPALPVIGLTVSQLGISSGSSVQVSLAFTPIDVEPPLTSMPTLDEVT